MRSHLPKLLAAAALLLSPGCASPDGSPAALAFDATANGLHVTGGDPFTFWADYAENATRSPEAAAPGRWLGLNLTVENLAESPRRLIGFDDQAAFPARSVFLVDADGRRMNAMAAPRWEGDRLLETDLLQPGEAAVVSLLFYDSASLAPGDATVTLGNHSIRLPAGSARAAGWTYWMPWA